MINVLPKESFDEAHIPGSKNAPVDDERFIERREREVRDKTRKVIVCCASTYCDASPKAARKLEAA